MCVCICLQDAAQRGRLASGTFKKVGRLKAATHASSSRALCVCQLNFSLANTGVAVLIAEALQPISSMVRHTPTPTPMSLSRPSVCVCVCAGWLCVCHAADGVGWGAGRPAVCQREEEGQVTEELTCRPT